MRAFRVPCVVGLATMVGCSAAKVSDSDSNDESAADEPKQGPDAFEPFVRSGARLEHRGWLAGEIGAYDRTWDTELGVHCSFVRAEDGELYCLPGPLDGLNSGLSEVFTDASCSDAGRMYLQFDPEPACGVPPAVGRVVDEGECGPQSSLLGGQTWAADRLVAAEAPAEVYWANGGGCSLAGGVPEGSYYAAEALGPEDVVHATRVEELTAEGIGVVALEGDDGSRLVVAALDQRYDGVRHETLEQPEGERLVPAITARESGIFEPACGAELVYWAHACVAERVGAIVDAGIAYHPGVIVPTEEIEAGECGMWGEGDLPDDIHFRRGEVMGDDELLRLEEVLYGEGEIQVRVFAAETEERLMFADPPLLAASGPCTPMPGPGATEFSCVPAGAGERLFERWADPECTIPVLAAEWETDTEVGDAVFSRGGLSCGSDHRALESAWTVLGPHDGPVYGPGMGEGCFTIDEPGQWLAVEALELPTVDYGPLPESP